MLGMQKYKGETFSYRNIHGWYPSISIPKRMENFNSEKFSKESTVLLNESHVQLFFFGVPRM